jgi:hypothetical protein
MDLTFAEGRCNNHQDLLLLEAIADETGATLRVSRMFEEYLQSTATSRTRGADFGRVVDSGSHRSLR